MLYLFYFNPEIHSLNSSLPTMWLGGKTSLPTISAKKQGCNKLEKIDTYNQNNS